MTSTRSKRRRLSALVAAVAAAGALLAGCSSSKNSAETTTTTASPDQPPSQNIAGYTFTMRLPESGPTELPFPEGTVGDVQGFDISKDGTKIMTAYAAMLPPGQSADPNPVDKLLAAAKATDPQPGEVPARQDQPAQPFTSATLPDGRIIILGAAGEQVMIAIGQDRDQMIKALVDSATAGPDQTDQPTPPDQ